MIRKTKVAHLEESRFYGPVPVKRFLFFTDILPISRRSPPQHFLVSATGFVRSFCCEGAQLWQHRLLRRGAKAGIPMACITSVPFARAVDAANAARSSLALSEAE